MKIKIELFGASRDLSEKEFLELDIKGNSSLKDLRNEIINYVDEKFKGMINALNYGAPPHGGIAPGLDRIVMLLANED